MVGAIARRRGSVQIVVIVILVVLVVVGLWSQLRTGASRSAPIIDDTRQKNGARERKNEAGGLVPPAPPERGPAPASMPSPTMEESPIPISGGAGHH